MTDPHTPSTRKALVVRGGWPGHAPVETTDLFLPLLAEHGFETTIADSPEAYAETDLGAIDLIVQSVTMGEISGPAVKALAAAVAGGTGLAGWHGGIVDSFRASADYLQLTGGQFASHPGSGPEDPPGTAGNYRRHTIDVVANHEITAGIDSFELTTEQYWVLTDDLNEVLATTTLAARDGDPWARGVTCPAVWTRQWGQGRIFVATPGHTVEDLQHPSVRTIVERGLLWAAR